MISGLRRICDRFAPWQGIARPSFDRETQHDIWPVLMPPRNTARMVSTN